LTPLTALKLAEIYKEVYISYLLKRSRYIILINIHSSFNFNRI